MRRAFPTCMAKPGRQTRKRASPNVKQFCVGKRRRFGRGCEWDTPRRHRKAQVARQARGMSTKVFKSDRVRVDRDSGW